MVARAAQQVGASVSHLGRQQEADVGQTAAARELNLGGYRTACFMWHRIREAMNPPLGP
jgi:hypothetical protein